MMRSLIVSLAACAVLALVVTIHAACTNDGGNDEAECTSPLDCELRESCIRGTCVAQGDEGEGEAPIGGGNVDSTVLVESLCERLASCQVGGGETDCVNELNGQIEDMRSRNTEVCVRAADATVRFFTCVNGLTCQQLQADLSSSCPMGQEAIELQGSCTGGEGEGE
jgi:hypothetical protein